MRNIRSPVLAGEWYPGDPRELKRSIRDFLDRAPAPDPGGPFPIGLISPHAGVMYSGPTAARGYRRVEGRDFEIVAVLSPYHSYPSGDVMTGTASWYETPLGRIPVAHDLIDALRGETEITDVESENEHSIEIQLPFLQTVLKDFRLLPLMIGNRDVRNVEGIVRALEKALRGRKALLVASTDMHHLNSAEEVRRRDARVTAVLETFDLPEIRNALSPAGCTVCGKVPVSIVMDVAKRFGADRFETVHLTNSRDEFRGRYEGEYTVGYLSAVLTRERG
jgi:MEMO1 family protein